MSARRHGRIVLVKHRETLPYGFIEPTRGQGRYFFQAFAPWFKVGALVHFVAIRDRRGRATAVDVRLLSESPAGAGRQTGGSK